MERALQADDRGFNDVTPEDLAFVIWSRRSVSSQRIRFVEARTARVIAVVALIAMIAGAVALLAESAITGATLPIGLVTFRKGLDVYWVGLNRASTPSGSAMVEPSMPLTRFLMAARSSLVTYTARASSMKSSPRFSSESSLTLLVSSTRILLLASASCANAGAARKVSVRQRPCGTLATSRVPQTQDVVTTTLVLLMFTAESWCLLRRRVA